MSYDIKGNVYVPHSDMLLCLRIQKWLVGKTPDIKMA